MPYWTTEQVADYLGVSVSSIYESRRKGTFPGVVGSRRGGRRLRFPSDAIEEGKRAVEAGEDPDEGETTGDVDTAMLWALQGIKKTLDAIHNEIRKQNARAIPLRPIEVHLSEDDEPLEDIQGAWNEGAKGVTMPPNTAFRIEGNHIRGDEEE